MNQSNTKIQPCHLERMSGIYIRQSTPYQVRTNTASTRVQYDLSERAVTLGWKQDQIRIYDGDLGVSGSVPSKRGDFRQLIADVGVHKLGIILAFDVTRLARNNTDWHRLLDICGLSNTLVADQDGIYDLSNYNDRLVLGLKGTMSEAEHHLIRTRLTAGMEKKARDGELRKRLPIGFDYDEDGKVRLSADEAIRHVVELVFKKFDELGSGFQVYRYLQDAGLMLPRRRYKWDRIEWKEPGYEAVISILKNPRYTGAYIYGRSETIRTVDENGEVHACSRRLPQNQWKVVIKEQHPGYISWERYVENQRKIQANVLMRPSEEASRVLRNGRGILQGVIRCGVCGRLMATSYPSKGDAVRYNCVKRKERVPGQGICQSVAGSRLEEAVAEKFLEAMSPAGMDIALAALERLDNEKDGALQHLQDQLEKAQYEADRAKRQYNAVEPENRSVARTLETEWNARLRQVTEFEEKIAAYKQNELPALRDDERVRLLNEGLDIRRVWDSETTTSRDKKQLIRLAFRAVFVRITDSPRKAVLTLVWEGGATTEITVPLRQSGQHPVVDEKSIVEDIGKMATCMTDLQISRSLNARRIRTAKGLPFSPARVQGLRQRHKIPAYMPEKTSQALVYTAQQAAKELDVTISTILRWLKEGFLDGVQVAPYAPWQIRLPESVRLKTAERAPQGWLPIRKAARLFGVTSGTVLHWIQQGKVEAMIGGRGRRRGIRVNMRSAPKSAQCCLFDNINP